MKLINCNLSPLPFYDDYTFQNHRKDYAFGHVYPVVTYRNMLLPFQIVVSSSVTRIINIQLVYPNLAIANNNLLKEMVNNGLTLTKYADYTVITYPGTLPINSLKYEGQYFLVIITNAQYIYSDIFVAKNNIDDFLLLEYWNPYNFEIKNGIVDFSNNFKFKCYLPTQVGKPEYEFEEEATSRLGYDFIESQVSKKVYKFTAIMPEFLCDALRIVRMCQNKKITSKGYEYDAITFAMDVDWEDQGDLAAVECQFETDTIISNLGGFKPELLGGDYNNDYNNDYYDQQATNNAITVNVRAVASSTTGTITLTSDNASYLYAATVNLTFTDNRGDSHTVYKTIAAKSTINEVIDVSQYINVTITKLEVVKQSADDTNFKSSFSNYAWTPATVKIAANHTASETTIYLVFSSTGTNAPTILPTTFNVNVIFVGSDGTNVNITQTLLAGSSIGTVAEITDNVGVDSTIYNLDFATSGIAPSDYYIYELTHQNN